MDGHRVGEIGQRISYDSEGAFSRACLALFAHSPKDERSLSSEPSRGG
jgi:AraC-like DNA-binding protein